jgi:hypothetical protein
MAEQKATRGQRRWAETIADPEKHEAAKARRRAATHTKQTQEQVGRGSLLQTIAAARASAKTYFRLQYYSRSRCKIYG